MTRTDYGIEIKRTPCGAIDDYHYEKRGRSLRSQAFHALMGRIWRAVAGEPKPEPSTIKVGFRWDTDEFETSVVR